MKYDWQCMAYASAPKLSKAGQKHRKAYLKHWADRMNPSDPIELAHLEALKMDERRTSILDRLERRAFNKMMKARKAEQESEEMEEVPLTVEMIRELKVGDNLRVVQQDMGKCLTKGKRYAISEKFNENKGFAVKDDRGTRFGVTASVELFRLLRPKNPAFVNGKIDLSRAKIGSKWKTNYGKCWIFERVDLNGFWGKSGSGDSVARKDGTFPGIDRVLISPWTGA